MPDIAASARQLLRRAAGAPPRTTADPGVPTVATGAGATAAVAASLPDAAATTPLAPRLDLSAALGRAAAGARTTVSLPAAELSANLDLLRDAAERRLPLVIHVDGLTDHGVWHAAADSGAVQLLAGDVQHAVDLALVARRVAEEALTPVLVGMDTETASGVQDVALPGAAVLRRTIGAPRQVVHSAGLAQELLWGRHRRRLPAWHDTARPLAGGAVLPPAAALPSSAARRAYLDPRVAASLDEALDAVGAATGRPLAPLTTWHADGARVVLVVQGAAAESVARVAESSAGGPLAELLGGRKVGVVALTALRPLPGEELALAVAGADLAVVLERSDAPLDGDGPLTREVAGALHRVAARHRPRLESVVYGVGGFPLRAADLMALLELLHRKPARGESLRLPRYLGVDLDPAGEPWPKRQVVLDALRREAPDARHLGLAGRSTAPDPRPDGAHTFAVRDDAAAGAGQLTGELAALLQRLAGGHLRGRAGVIDAQGAPTADLLSWAPAPLADPGADAPVDTLVWTPAARPPTAVALGAVAHGGAVVFVRSAGGWRRPLSDDAVALATERKIRWFAAPAAGEDANFLQHRERVLGASLGVLAAAGRHFAGQAGFKPRELQEARRALLRAAEVDGESAEERVTAFLAGYDRLHETPLAELAEAAPAARQAAAAPPEVPAAVRDAGVGEPGHATVGSLPRLWDQVVGPQRFELQRFAAGGATLLPDPQLASGVLPARSAALATTAPSRATLPMFHPEACTGCGVCWSVCPDGAVAPVAVGGLALLESVMNRVSAEPLRMALRKLAEGLDKELSADPDRATRDLLEAAWERSVAKMPLSDERKTTVRQAFETVRDELAPLPLTRTEVLGDTPFALVLDPDACTGCGLCVAACEPEALTAAPDTPQRSREARRLWNLAASLPAPAEDAVEAVRLGADPLAAAMLPAAHRAVLTGADAAVPGDGATLAARQALAVAAEVLAPRRAELLGRLDERAEALAAAIQGALSRALPSRDLDALAHGLDALDRSEAELTDLIGRVEAAFDSDRVDVPRLRHLVDAARELADLRWRLTSGESGDGRALFSVVSHPGSEIVWPFNPWAVPVTVAAGGDAAARALGVLDGQLQRAIEVIRALRRAGLELEAVERKRSGGPAAESRLEEELEGLSRLTWRDLEPEERRLCPPLFLVADETSLLRTSLSGLAALLRSDLPAKVLLLTATPAGELPLTVPTLHAQTSVADGAQLHAAVTAALEHGGPALLRTLAPVPAPGTLASDATVQRARETVTAGEWELFVRRPGETEADEEERELVPNAEVEELRRAHQEELTRLQAEHEQRLANLRAEVRGELAQQVRGRLLALALRRRNGESSEESAP